MLMQRLVNPVRKARIHAERHIAGCDHFIERHRQHHRHALAAKFRVTRKAGPAAIDKGAIGRLEAIGCGDRTVFMAGAALLVTHPVKRLQNLLANLRAFGQHRLQQIRPSRGIGRQIAQPLQTQNLTHQKAELFQRCLIDRHGVLLKREAGILFWASNTERSVKMSAL